MEEHDELFIAIDESKLANIVRAYWEQMKEYTILTNGMAGIKIGDKYYVCDNDVIYKKEWK